MREEDNEMDTYECDYCGQSDPEMNYTVSKSYPNEPERIVCDDCMDEQPWK